MILTYSTNNSKAVQELIGKKFDVLFCEAGSPGLFISRSDPNKNLRTSSVVAVKSRDEGLTVVTKNKSVYRFEKDAEETSLWKKIRRLVHEII